MPSDTTNVLLEQKMKYYVISLMDENFYFSIVAKLF